MGLWLSADHKLEMINPDAKIVASVAVAPSSLEQPTCGSGAAAWILPAVSASAGHVYFRDGDTRVRMLVPPSSAVDVTTVPGGTNVVSGFSVSPDDLRIAVSTETFTPTAITDRLYVEDLHGGGHHADIYSTSVPAGNFKQPVMLWPMGWHQGELVLAVWPACSFEQVSYPQSWHVVSATTAARVASIGDLNCIPAPFPSPAGVACFDPTTPGHVRVYGWNGALRATLVTDTEATELSPSGNVLAQGTYESIDNSLNAGPPVTTMLLVGGGGMVTVNGYFGCLWIDDSRLLAENGVIDYPSGDASRVAQVGGQCVGRLPGTL